MFLVKWNSHILEVFCFSLFFCFIFFPPQPFDISLETYYDNFNTPVLEKECLKEKKSHKGKYQILCIFELCGHISSSKYLSRIQTGTWTESAIVSDPRAWSLHLASGKHNECWGFTLKGNRTHQGNTFCSWKVEELLNPAACHK